MASISAKNFAALGAHVAICGRIQEKLDAAATELRALCATVCPIIADVRDFAALKAAFARSRAEPGPMDVLVCGAAGNFLAPAGKLVEIDGALFEGEEYASRCSV